MGIENGDIVRFQSVDGQWSGNLQRLYKNSYYIITLKSEILEYKLLIPSIEIDGNGIVTDNFEINTDNNQEWLGKNEYDNIYYYPVLPKLNVFGKFDDDLGLQQGSYDPFRFEQDIGIIIDDGSGDDGDGDDNDNTDLPPIISNIEKIPFGSPNRNWWEDDFYSPVTNKTEHRNKAIDLDYSEIDGNVIQDRSGMSNYGQILGDYLIEYDYNTREPSTSGIKEVNSLKKRDERNSKRNY